MNYRKATVLLCLTLFIAFSAFTSVGKRKHLIRKWMPEKITIGEKVKTFDDDEKDKSLEFLKNGKYAKDGGDESGKWELSKNGKTLTMEGGEFEGIWTVVELNKKRCTMSFTKHEEKITLYMIPFVEKGKKKD